LPFFFFFVWFSKEKLKNKLCKKIGKKNIKRSTNKNKGGTVNKKIGQINTQKKKKNKNNMERTAVKPGGSPLALARMLGGTAKN